MDIKFIIFFVAIYLIVGLVMFLIDKKDAETTLEFTKYSRKQRIGIRIGFIVLWPFQFVIFFYVIFKKSFSWIWKALTE